MCVNVCYGEMDIDGCVCGCVMERWNIDVYVMERWTLMGVCECVLWRDGTLMCVLWRDGH